MLVILVKPKKKVPTQHAIVDATAIIDWTDFGNDASFA
jgi:hypothetical protein